MARVRRRRRWWEWAALVFSVVVAIAGLAVVGLVIMLTVAMNSYGSNK